jgi:hypothetical protein
MVETEGTDVVPLRVSSRWLWKYLHEGLPILEKQGYRIITLSESAHLRSKLGLDHNISQQSFWVQEGAIYIQRGKNYLVRRSPILYDLERAVTKGFKAELYKPSNEAIEEALKDSIEIPTDSIKIPTNRLADEQITAFPFGDSAKLYGDFLWSNDIRTLNVGIVDNRYKNRKKKTFCTQVSIGDLPPKNRIQPHLRNITDSHISLNSSFIKGSNNNRVRGIKEVF